MNSLFEAFETYLNQRIAEQVTKLAFDPTNINDIIDDRIERALSKEDFEERIKEIANDGRHEVFDDYAERITRSQEFEDAVDQQIREFLRNFVSIQIEVE